MPYIVQMYFDKDAPFGEEMVPVGRARAESINLEPGFIWKIWTEDADDHKAGGIYLFETKEDAENYMHMHTERLAKLGHTNFVSKIFAVNLGLTAINKGPLKPNE